MIPFGICAGIFACVVNAGIIWGWEAAGFCLAAALGGWMLRDASMENAGKRPLRG